MLASKTTTGKEVYVAKGKVAGFDQRCTGFSNGKAKIVLEELGRVDPKLDYYNKIQIKGTPNLTETMSVPSGKYTTSAHAVNLILAVLNAAPGLLTMKDMPLAWALPDKH